MSELTYSITADQIADVVPVYHNSRRVPLFIGSPGIAKTAFVREGASQLGRALNQNVAVRELHLASMSEVDVRGYLIPVGNKATFTQPEFWAAVEANPHGILFLDEFMQATHEVQKAVAPLVLEGRIGEYLLPVGWSVMLAGNGLNDGAGANTLLSHIINRVQLINVKAPDPDVWVMWAVEAGIPYELIAFAKYRPNVVFDGALPAAPNEPYCTPRSLHSLGDVAKAYPGGIRAMVDGKVGMAIINGAIGRGAATELVSLVRTAINLPSFESVVSDPDNTPVPTKPDEMYAMTMLMAVRCGVVNVDPVVRYLSRLPTNFTVTGIVSMCKRDRALFSSKEMANWVRSNREVLSKFSRYITEAI